jgi:hypothetical protein
MASVPKEVRVWRKFKNGYWIYIRLVALAKGVSYAEANELQVCEAEDLLQLYIIPNSYNYN